jgi:predicted transposase YbfD/YdcC
VTHVREPSHGPHTRHNALIAGPPALIAQPRPLSAVLTARPDFRSKQGQRHPLGAIFALVCSALMCGYRSYTAMAAWGRTYGTRLTHALGFTRQPPCAATLHAVLKGIDRKALEARRGAWAEGLLAATSASQTAPEGLAIDGKTLRGSQKQGAPGVHLLSALGHRLGLTLAQPAVADKTNELPVVMDLFRQGGLGDRVVTMDALLTQRPIAQQLVAAGGDYVMGVKAHPPHVWEDIAPVFALPPIRGEIRTVVEPVDCGHGRIEHRRLDTRDVLVGYSDGPGLAQVFQLKRHVISNKTGAVRQAGVMGVTSLAAERADAARVLALVRGHWHIENKSQGVRDVTFDDDRSQGRGGNSPQVLAALRNTVMRRMRQAGETNLAAACRRFAAQPACALELSGMQLEN